MKLYRVEFWTDTDGHEGFSWFSSRERAERAARDYRRANRRWYELDGVTTYDPGAGAEVEAFDVDATRAGLLTFLNDHASHPNNG